MAADGERLPRQAGVGVRRRRRHAGGARRGGEASPGVHPPPLPEERVPGPPTAHAVCKIKPTIKPFNSIDEA